MKKDKKKILIVDDEVKIIEVIKSYIENNDFYAFSANNGNEAINLFYNINPDLVILDLMLPDINGEDICKFLRIKKSKVPIIMLTAKIAEEDMINGFDMGADDYITKPFSPRELIARVKALLRRVEVDEVQYDDLYSFRQNDLVIDNISYEVRKSGRLINLTPNEYNILITMAKYPSKVFTREELIHIALSKNFEGYDRAVDSHIKNLRQKIEDDPKNPDYIQTIRGIGYKFGDV
ncbi:response regulator transcription factor [Clostridium pasteurianum]|uniref:response regulator transcription factor n=1 Tax=Clostridium pasteurianum TaxID=1501 RepID=UPI002260F397|nr:response regulator transcription factor [Clostridium pasteurianum]UZW13763.1 response regulator transcription factor [Clostridium pasteurianum]